MKNNYIFVICTRFPIDWCQFERNLDFDQNRPKCLNNGSGKFAIFTKILTWVKKIIKNREKFANSKKLIFRILKLHFRVKIAI